MNKGKKFLKTNEKKSCDGSHAKKTRIIADYYPSPVFDVFVSFVKKKIHRYILSPAIANQKKITHNLKVARKCHKVAHSLLPPKNKGLSSVQWSFRGLEYVES